MCWFGCILQPHIDLDLMQTFVVFNKIYLIEPIAGCCFIWKSCSSVFFNALIFESARFVSTVMLLIIYVLAIWLVLPPPRVVVLITHESIVVLRVLVVRSAAPHSGVLVCAVLKTNNDALMEQAAIENIWEWEHWVGPAFIFSLLNADTLTWRRASMFDSGWVSLAALRLQIISTAGKV